MPESPATFGASLAWARERVDRIDARVLLAHVVGCDASYLVAHPEAPLAPEASTRFTALVARCAEGEPVAYLLGSREFYGRAFKVGPGALIPRPDTELLVELAGRLPARPPTSILDLGTGSGALAVTLALEWPAAEVAAVERSGGALAIARENAERLGARVAWHQGDWFDALPDGRRFELIVANPPYVRADDPHLAALRFEPSAALVAGADGLDDIRRIVARASAHMDRGGWLLVEHGHDQAAAVRALLDAAGLCAVGSWRDLAGIERVSGGRLDGEADGP